MSALAAFGLGALVGVLAAAIAFIVTISSVRAEDEDV